MIYRNKIIKWRMKGGATIPIAKMDDSHLINTVNYVLNDNEKIKGQRYDIELHLYGELYKRRLHVIPLYNSDGNENSKTLCPICANIKHYKRITKTHCIKGDTWNKGHYGCTGEDTYITTDVVNTLKITPCDRCGFKSETLIYSPINYHFTGLTESEHIELEYNFNKEQLQLKKIEEQRLEEQRLKQIEINKKRKNDKIIELNKTLRELEAKKDIYKQHKDIFNKELETISKEYIQIQNNINDLINKTK